MTASRTKKAGSRPVGVFNCTETHDHPGHRWRFSEQWPEGVFWWCRGYDREEARLDVIATEKAIRDAGKRDKPTRARIRRSVKNFRPTGAESTTEH